MRRYNPTEIEQKWQNKWEADGTYVVDFNNTTRPKYYSLSMLPGITGAGIHIGHGRTFQFADIKARFKRQQGYNVYHPIGWDSFGLPVENYAIKVGKAPRVAHDEAKVHFKEQLKRLGFSYDWTKETSKAPSISRCRARKQNAPRALCRSDKAPLLSYKSQTMKVSSQISEQSEFDQV